MKNYFACIVCVALVVFPAWSDTHTRPPTVAISAFKMGFDTWYQWGNVRVIRDQVAAHLTEEYECVVMNRSCSYAMTLEDSVKRLSVIAESKFESDTIYSADYIVTGIFQPSDKGNECVLRIADLRNPEKPRTQIDTFKVGSVDTAASLVAKRIATITKATIRNPVSPNVQSLSWVVMPFRHVTYEWKPNEPPHPLALEMALRTEMALQTNTLIRLVDHMMLETILKENSMKSLADAGNFRHLSKLTGADRLLIGTLSEGKNKKIRVDLLSVDTVTSEVLGAVTAVNIDSGQLGETVENLTGKLVSSLHSPTALTPASIQQREQEAELYIRTAEMENIAMRTTSGYLNVLEYAEMAYLVARDSEPVIRRMIKAFSTLCKASSSNFNAGKIEIARFVDKIAENHPNIRFDLRLLVDRAEAYYYTGRYEEALRVMRIYQEHNQGPMTSGIARLVTAQSYFALNQPKKALEYLPKDDLEWGNRQIWRLLRARVCRSLGDEDGEFEALDTFGHFKQHNKGAIENEMERYLELLARRKSPAAVVDFLDKAIQRDYHFSAEKDAQFLRAKYCLDAGEKVRAAKICQRLWETGVDTQWKWDHPFAANKEFKEKLAALRVKTGDYPEKWLKAREIQPFPTQYVVYLQPVGTVDMRLIESFCADVQDFYGATTKILPSLPLSKDSPSYYKERNQFEAQQLFNELSLKVKIPADTFILSFITRESLFSLDTPVFRFIRSRRDGYISLNSYASWADWDLQFQKPAVRSHFLCNIVFGMGLFAGDYPCITSGGTDQFVCTRRKIAFCEEMQAKYKALDLEKERNKAMEYYASKGIEVLKN
jgi:tetratricopeptide (TPR) repeat protein